MRISFIDLKLFAYGKVMSSPKYGEHYENEDPNSYTSSAHTGEVLSSYPWNEGRNTRW
jgi:hypothetical protein